MFSWNILIPFILRKRPHEDIVIPKHLVIHPLEEGFTETFGELQGQLRDYELTLPDGKRIHVREFKDHYKAHWDKISPRINPLEHLRRDAPHWWIIFTGAVGAMLSYLKSRKLENAIEGLLLGMFIGSLTAEN